MQSSEKVALYGADEEAMPLVEAEDIESVLVRGDIDLLDSRVSSISETWNARIERVDAQPYSKRLHFLPLCLLGIALSVVGVFNIVNLAGVPQYLSVLSVTVGVFDIFLSVQLFTPSRLDILGSIFTTVLRFWNARRVAFWCLAVVLLSVIFQEAGLRVAYVLYVLHVIPVLFLVKSAPLES